MDRDLEGLTRQALHAYFEVPEKKPVQRFRRFDVVRCLCGRCMGPQQILRIDKKSSPVRYKVAYYNAIFGGRHWVTEGKLGFL